MRETDPQKKKKRRGEIESARSLASSSPLIPLLSLPPLCLSLPSGEGRRKEGVDQNPREAPLPLSPPPLPPSFLYNLSLLRKGRGKKRKKKEREKGSDS